MAGACVPLLFLGALFLFLFRGAAHLGAVGAGSTRHQSASEGASFLAAFFLAVALGLASAPDALNWYLAGRVIGGNGRLTASKLALSRP